MKCVQVHLYLGLAMFCGFVLYDTQLIVEKCRQGDCDYIRFVVTLKVCVAVTFDLTY